MSKSIKKRYLKALNRQLRKETAGKFESAFVFYPLGAKPKNATGVTASGHPDAQVLAVMEAIQARVFAKVENSSKRE